MAEGYTATQRRTVLLACCCAGFITPLLSTMMNLSLLNIGEEFGVGTHQQAYVNTAFLLSSVVFMVPMARIGDIIGKKKVFLLGVATLALICLVATQSPSFWFLIACRVVMGFGSASIVTTSIAMITDVYPPQNRGGAIGYQTTCVYMGLAIGPALGGFLNDAFGWHSLFLIVVPISVAALALMSTFRYDIAQRAGTPMDVKGAVLYGFAITFSMGGMINLPETWAVASLAVGAVLLVLFVVSQLRTEHYLLNVRLFKGRVFAGSCATAFMNYAASYSISFFVALYLQSIGQLNATQSGMLMLIQPAIQAMLTAYFGRLSDRLSDKRILPTLGMAVTAVGLGMIMTFGTVANLPFVVATFIVLGIGFSMFSAPNTSVIMGSVKPHETGEASATVAVMRQTGMMVSMGIAMLFISLIMGSTDDLGPETYGSFISVIRCSFGLCLVMCIIGVFLSMMRGKGTGNEC